MAHETRGLLLLREGHTAAAVDPLRRATTLDPDRANAWNLLGVALERGAGDHVGALAAWQRALDLAPDRFDVLFNLATVAADCGETEIAPRASHGSSPGSAGDLGGRAAASARASAEPGGAP